MLKFKKYSLLLILLYAFLKIFSYSKFVIKRNRNILYLSLHQGTIDEVAFVFERKGISFTIGNLNKFKEFDIFQKVFYKVNTNIAKKYLALGHVKKLCDQYDMIMIGDTIPMGWPFYLATPGMCKAKIALQLTQRFNHEVSEMRIYSKLMQKLTSNRNVYWVPNNPYEITLLNMYNIYPKPERTFMIRPFGISNYKKQRIKQKKNIIYTFYLTQMIREILKNNSVSNHTYEIHSFATYGGPLTA